MSLKINTVADRIRNNLIDSKKLCNMRDFANSENMVLTSIPLKNGTCAKILANAVEYDCLIMKNGKILTARGQSGTADNVAVGILGLFQHIEKRGRADSNINVSNESFGFIEDYLRKFDKFMTSV